jgi:exopolyphosphatase / guanosine-5'-triphosphate,3'-diphosphate pyrophosphatase
LSGVRAAVDVGTNSVRLLVVDGHGTTLVREMEITRLGRGVDDRGHLDDDSLGRTLRVLGRYRDLWEERGATHVRIGATSAVRDASDRDRFFDGVREVTGAEAEVLSGDDEAAIAFAGVTARLDVTHPVVVLDIGGGSTEIIVGDPGGELVASVSLQLGCVRLAERCLRDDPPTPDELRAAEGEAAREIDDGVEELRSRGADPTGAASFVGVAGTVTTLTALHLGLDTYDPGPIHATRLPTDVVHRLTQELAAMSTEERAQLGPMASGREDVIVAGAVILGCALDRLGFDGVIASEADILDGLALLAAEGG